MLQDKNFSFFSSHSVPLATTCSLGHCEPLNKQETICVHTLSGKFNIDNPKI